MPQKFPIPTGFSLSVPLKLNTTSLPLWFPGSASSLSPGWIITTRLRTLSLSLSCSQTFNTVLFRNLYHLTRTYWNKYKFPHMISGLFLCLHYSSISTCFVFVSGQSRPFQSLFILFFFFFCLFRASSTAYGSSQARGQVRAVAASLSHRNRGSELCLRPTP